MILSTPLPTILNFDLEAISAPPELDRYLHRSPEPIPSPALNPDPEPDLDLFLRHLRAKSVPLYSLGPSLGEIFHVD